MKTTLLSVQEIKQMFDKINQDNPEHFVGFNEVEYYAQQIQNMFSVTESKAIRLARQLYTLAQNESDLSAKNH